MWEENIHEFLSALAAPYNLLLLFSLPPEPSVATTSSKHFLPPDSQFITENESCFLNFTNSDKPLAFSPGGNVLSMLMQSLLKVTRVFQLPKVVHGHTIKDPCTAQIETCRTVRSLGCCEFLKCLHSRDGFAKGHAEEEMGFKDERAGA